MIAGKHIVLGISGSIAAYKACSLIRLLIKEGAEVQVIITPSGKEFISPLTLATLTSKPVISDFFAEKDGSWNSHVELGIWADAMIVAPATAATIGKMAHGIADNMLITTYLSMKAPTLIAPAMDLDMYAHPSTVRNLQILKEYGNHIIEAASGELASHLIGKGRMEEPEKIVEALRYYFLQQEELKDKKILITAGPTYEKIDPVRFIGNFSSGKMGYALAEECAKRGAIVELISGPVNLEAKHANIHRINVVSAKEMHAVAQEKFKYSDVAILCAAVADYRVCNYKNQKIKRTKDNLELKLIPTEDIAASLGKMKRLSQKIIGFALETENELENARKKLMAKNFDFIVLNSMSEKGTCFNSDNNKVSIISALHTKDFPLQSKKEVAKDIIDELCLILN